MAKARLEALTKKWINGETERRQDVKTTIPRSRKASRQKGVKTESHKDAQIEIEEKTKLTLHLSKEAVKWLWHNRAETGETMSRAVERLVMGQIKKR